MMGIDHESLMQQHTRERYFLGELPAQERDAFEEHLADCAVCLQELAAANIFAANASAVFADLAAAKATAKPAGWQAFLRPYSFPALAFSGALNVALLLFAGYGLLRLERASPPRSGASEMFTVHPPARGGESQVCAVGKAKAFATLRFDLAQPYQKYSYTLEGAGTVPVAPPGASETLDLTVALAGIAPGDHKFRVTGWNGQHEVEIGECVLRVAPGQ